ncbi:hypothetical protein VZ95_17800, partial [Elstera litoralis]
MGVFIRGGRIDDPGDMAGACQQELHRPTVKLRARVSAFPRRDMIFARRDDQRRYLHFTQVNLHTVEFDAARLDQKIFLIHFAQVETMHGGGHARGIAVPIEQIEGERVFPEQVVIHHERPNEIIRAQHIEAIGHIA